MFVSLQQNKIIYIYVWVKSSYMPSSQRSQCSLKVFNNFNFTSHQQARRTQRLVFLQVFCFFGKCKLLTLTTKFLVWILFCSLVHHLSLFCSAQFAFGHICEKNAVLFLLASVLPLWLFGGRPPRRFFPINTIHLHRLLREKMNRIWWLEPFWTVQNRSRSM